LQKSVIYGNKYLFSKVGCCAFAGDALLMYESFFALTEKPFVLTPNPRFLFLSKTHNEVYAHLIYGIENRAGFVEVTGEVGTGKTTVLRTLLAHLDNEAYRVAFIFNPKLTAFELLRNINREFGVADDGPSNPDLINTLNEFLLDENEAGRTPVLVIDEAQNLSGEVLEQIRLISNLETETDKLIQIVLVGQPELRHHLRDHSLRQLNQRIAVRYQLRTLNREETVSYILHRLHVAGRPDGNLFSSKALTRVFQCSDGIPRRINLICDRALLTAYSEERTVVSQSDVNQAVKELDGAGGRSHDLRQLLFSSVAALIALFVLLAGFFWLDPFGHESVGENITRPVRSQPESTDITASQSMAQEQRTTSPPDSMVTGLNALLRRWEAPQLSAGTTIDSFDFDREFGLRGFKLVRLASTFSDLKNFNLPVLLPLSEKPETGYLAVLNQGVADRWTVSPAYQGRNTMTSIELDRLGVRPAVVPWVDFASVDEITVPGIRGENVRRLQYLLGLNGCMDVRANGRYDKASINCVKNFQRVNGLTVDGLVGPRTLILLYQAAGAYQMPRLKEQGRRPL
jgi:general secretion pathway protein A